MCWGIREAALPPHSFLGMQKTDFLRSPFSVSALPIFPARLQASIFGAGELNCRVRNGNGWTLTAISTDCYFNCSHTAKTDMKLILVTRAGIEPTFAA